MVEYTVHVVKPGSRWSKDDEVRTSVIPATESTTSLVPVGRWQSLGNWIKEHKIKFALLLIVLIITPIFIGSLDYVLTHHSSHETNLVQNSNDNSTSTPLLPTTPLSSSSATSTTTFIGKSVTNPFNKSTTSASIAPAATTTKAVVALSVSRSTCFPLGSASLPSSGVPNVSPKSWWCQSSLMYGFMGWSYPLEAADCSDPTNSYASINSDFERMKSRGARMVRIYAPECREISVWENLVKAAVNNDMGIIPMVWWGFLNDQNLWQTSQANLISLFTTSPYAKVAPYVVHSIAFGSEPIGDQVDGGPAQFVSDLAKFRKKMKTFGVPVGVSEDWDRNGPGYDMNSTTGNGVGTVGQMIKSNTDLVMAHMMPYYHPSETPLVADVLSYMTHYLTWLNKYVGKPIFITETMWASTSDAVHGRGGDEDQVNLPDFKLYWSTFTNNCKMFKKMKVGWFFHTWSDAFELGFGYLDDNNSPKIPNFMPPRC